MVVENPADCLKTRPKTVALLGLGRSVNAYKEEMCGTGTGLHFDEVWAVNFGAKVFRHDKLFVMDDLRVQSNNLPEYGTTLKRHDTPIITSKAYPEFPMSVEFPIKEVVDYVKDDFINSTVGYALTWAIYIGVKEISLYGCDFHYPNAERREEGGQCAAYWLGYMRGKGIVFKLPLGTTLMGVHTVEMRNNAPHRPLYGYAEQPLMPPKEEEKPVEVKAQEVSPDGTNAHQDSGIQEDPGDERVTVAQSEASGSP